MCRKLYPKDVQIQTDVPVHAINENLFYSECALKTIEKVSFRLAKKV